MLRNTSPQYDWRQNGPGVGLSGWVCEGVGRCVGVGMRGGVKSVPRPGGGLPGLTCEGVGMRGDQKCTASGGEGVGFKHIRQFLSNSVGRKKRGG